MPTATKTILEYDTNAVLAPVPYDSLATGNFASISTSVLVITC